MAVPSFLTIRQPVTKPSYFIVPSEAEYVLSICAEYFGADPIDMERRRKFAECVNARHAAWMIFVDRGASPTQISRAYDCDHTSIIHGTSRNRRKELAAFLPEIRAILAKRRAPALNESFEDFCIRLGRENGK